MAGIMDGLQMIQEINQSIFRWPCCADMKKSHSGLK